MACNWKNQNMFARGLRAPALAEGVIARIFRFTGVAPPQMQCETRTHTAPPMATNPQLTIAPVPQAAMTTATTPNEAAHTGPTMPAFFEHNC